MWQPDTREMRKISQVFWYKGKNIGDSGGTKEVKRLLGEQRCPRSGSSCFLDSRLLGVLFYLINLYSYPTADSRAWKPDNFRDWVIKITHVHAAGKAFAWYAGWQGAGWAAIAAAGRSYWNCDWFSASFLVPLVFGTALLLHHSLAVAQPKMHLQLILHHREVISLLVQEGNLQNWCIISV